MEALRRRFLRLILPVVMIVAVSLGSVEPVDGQDVRVLSFQLKNLTIFPTSVDTFDDEVELQIFVVMTDGTGDVRENVNAAKWSWPAEGVLRAKSGESVQLGKYFPSVDESSISDRLYVYVLAVDVDDQPPGARLATDFVLGMLSSALVTAVGLLVGVPTGGVGLVASLSLDVLVGQGTQALADWAREADVIGEQLIVLERANGWEEGSAKKCASPDGGLEFVYQVLIDTEPSVPSLAGTPTEASNESSLTQTPIPPGTRTPTPTETRTAEAECQEVLCGEFRSLWSRYHRELGCAVTSWQSDMVVQPFERGEMTWMKSPPGIYVLYNSGTWKPYDDIKGPNDPPCAEAANTGGRGPVRGFGLVWCDFERVALGDPLDVERASQGIDGVPEIVQRFEQGIVFTLGPSRRILFDTGQWRQF